MKYALLFWGLCLSLAAMAQRADTFSVSKQSASVKGRFVTDTFVQQTWLSSNTEKSNHIVYRTGIKIINGHQLIYFKATQSILDSLGVTEEKNASVGEYRKLPYLQKNDSLFFVIKFLLPSMRNNNKQVEITKGYSGAKRARSIMMEITTTANNDELAPKTEKQVFTLFKQDLLITRRKR